MTNQEQYDMMCILSGSDDSTAQKCAKYISNYCKNFEYCTDCQFMKKINGIGCIFNNVTPDNWEGFINENIHS